MTFAHNPAPKPKHGRGKPKRGQVTAITNKVRQEVNRRSMEKMGTDCPVCEHCGYARELTKGHLDNASQGGSGSEPWNIANICGSHGTNGCHDWADNTAEGREWKENYKLDLIEYYHKGEGRQHWRM